MNPKWLYQSAAQLLPGLKQGTIGSRALLDTYLARIEAKNPALNAVIATDVETARRRADAADRALSNGKPWGPLHGLPMTVKDSYEVQGMPCTSGAPALRAHRPQKSAVAVQRLVDAGAIIFGKTNVPLYASDVQTYNKLFGTTSNPWNTGLTPGGSSGGAAAALAAGFTALELGSDIGGSIRIPAHFCGVYGHKPTHGVISLRGHIPGPPGALAEPDLNVAGPMARSAEDLGLMLDVLAGPGPSLQAGWQIRLPAAAQQKLADFRVLMWLEDPLCPIDRQIKNIYQQLQATLEEHGARLGTGAPLGMGLGDFHPTYLTLLGAVPPVSGSKLGPCLMGLCAPVLASIGRYLGAPKHAENFMAGAAQSHANWLGTHEKRLRIAEKFAAIFAQYDVILMPVAASPAFKHQQAPLPLRSIPVNGENRNYLDLIMWVAPATLMGLPATSAPAGFTAQGLPVNVQIVGAAFQDKTTIKFAQLLAKAIGGFVVPPGY